MCKKCKITWNNRKQCEIIKNNASQYLKISRAKLPKMAYKMLNLSALNHIKAVAAKENPSILNW